MSSQGSGTPPRDQQPQRGGNAERDANEQAEEDINDLFGDERDNYEDEDIEGENLFGDDMER